MEKLGTQIMEKLGKPNNKETKDTDNGEAGKQI